MTFDLTPGEWLVNGFFGLFLIYIMYEFVVSCRQRCLKDAVLAGGLLIASSMLGVVIVGSGASDMQARDYLLSLF